MQPNRAQSLGCTSRSVQSIVVALSLNLPSAVNASSRRHFLICDGRAAGAPISDRPSQKASNAVKLSQVEPPHAISFEFVNKAQNFRTQRFVACQKDKRGQRGLTIEFKHRDNNIQGIRDESIACNVRSFGTGLPIGRRYPQATRAVCL